VHRDNALLRIASFEVGLGVFADNYLSILLSMSSTSVSLITSSMMADERTEDLPTYSIDLKPFCRD
jgi:hypothetical protein